MLFCQKDQVKRVELLVKFRETLWFKEAQKDTD